MEKGEASQYKLLSLIRESIEQERGIINDKTRKVGWRKYELNDNIKVLK